MPPLPTFEGNSCRPFEIIGLDYFGPVLVKLEDNTHIKIKKWVCLFTCLATRNIHLEVVHDMSTVNFLNSFRRFIALRSQPRIIYSDNATQFRAANKTLAQLWNKLIVDQELCTYYANQGIIWRFITEYAPWQGVYYERLIGIVKLALQKTIGRKVLNFAEFRTLIYEVVAIVNSRPLTYVYDEPTSPIIRPMDFLQLGGPTGLIPVGTFEDPDYILPQEGKELFNLFKGNLALTDAYWEVFKEEYLLSLREQQTMLHEGDKQTTHTLPKPDDTVLVKELDLRRGEWKMGRIKAIKKRNNGYIKSITVILPNQRLVERSSNVLYPLECAFIAKSEDSIFSYC